MNVDMLIIVFFRLLNFAVLIGIIVYLWHQYGREFVLAEFEKGKAYLVSLVNSSSLLRKVDKSIKKGYKDDEKERLELKERLLVWRDVMEKDKQDLELQKEERVAIVQERMKEQVRRVQEYRLYRQIQKEAIDEVRDTLQKQYDGSDAQNKVIQNIMKRLDAHENN